MGNLNFSTSAYAQLLVEQQPQDHAAQPRLGSSAFVKGDWWGGRHVADGLSYPVLGSGRQSHRELALSWDKSGGVAHSFNFVACERC